MTHKKQDEELREKMKQELDAFAVQVVDYSTGMSDEYTDTVQLTDRLLSFIHFYANEARIDELKRLKTNRDNEPYDQYKRLDVRLAELEKQQ